MTRVGRISGALLVETTVDGTPAWYLVGATKRPCDWERAGFRAPTERDPKLIPFVKLEALGTPALAGAIVTFALGGEPAAAFVAERLLVKRTGSVSERLWRLIFGVEDEADAPGEEVLDGEWLAAMPVRIWDVVRDAVLKCS